MSCVFLFIVASLDSLRSTGNMRSTAPLVASRKLKTGNASRDPKYRSARHSSQSSAERLRSASHSTLPRPLDRIHNLRHRNLDAGHSRHLADDLADGIASADRVDADGG